jgi:hypothetical protein
MDLTWLALSVGALAMLVVAYLAQSIGNQDAGTPQSDAVADYPEVSGRTFGKSAHQTIRIELLIDRSCHRRFLAP